LKRSYEAFAGEPEYLELNTRFIETVLLSEVDSFLDLGCGTGTLTFLILEAMAAARGSEGRRDHEASIIGVDISRESLELAQVEWIRRRRANSSSLNFVQATVESLPFASGSFDMVIIVNATQLLDDREKVIGEAHRLLRCGGVFAFSTSFYAGTFSPGTERL